MWKYDVYIGRRMLWVELSGERKSRLPKRRFTCAVTEDMADVTVEATQEDADDRTN